MKKALKGISLATGITAAVMGFIGLIAMIITVIGAGFSTLFILPIIIILAELAMGILLCVGGVKGKNILLLIAAIVLFVLLILDVALQSGAFLASGALFGGLTGSMFLVTLFMVFGIITMLLALTAIILQIVVMVQKPAASAEVASDETDINE